MSTLKIATVGVLGAVLLPLALALFLVVSITAFLYSLPGGQLAASGLSYFVSREVPPVNIPPGGPVFVAPDPEALDPYGDMIASAAGRFGVDPRLIMAVILVESGGNPLATSPAGGNPSSTSASWCSSLAGAEKSWHSSPRSWNWP